jgi:sugar/nucleoside kinase (ribokinase family)
VSRYDVLLLGEPLVEFSTLAPFGDGIPARMGVSGDVVNAAAAAAEVLTALTPFATLLGRGARAVAVACGSAGVHLADQTGAGDVFAGTVTARLALGDPVDDAARLGAAAASLAIGGQGGTGCIAALAEVRAHAGVSA